MNEQKRRRGRPATLDRATALAAAVQLFWRHGYEGTSISMLTEAMGVTAPTLYSAFGSKEQLYCDALAAYQHGGSTSGSAAVQDKTAYEIVEAYLRMSAVRFTSPDQGRGCMLLNGSVQRGPDGEGAASATTLARALALEQFAALLENAKAKGEILPTVDALTLARFYMGCAQGMAIQGADGAKRDELEAVVETALNAWPTRR